MAKLKSLEHLLSMKMRVSFCYGEQFDAHVLRFRGYQREYMRREYRMAGEEM